MATRFDEYVAIFQDIPVETRSRANTTNICVDGSLPTVPLHAQTHRNVHCEHCDHSTVVLDITYGIFRRCLQEFQAPNS